MKRGRPSDDLRKEWIWAVPESIHHSCDPCYMYDEDSDTEEIRGSFGVLSVDENKSMRFLGATAVEVRIGFPFTSS